MRPARHAVLLLATAAFLGAGCAARSPQVSFYALSGPQGVTTLEPALGELVVGVGPVVLPSMLRRSQIVMRSSGNQLVVNEYHRWAGTLEDDILRVLGETIGERLGTSKVMVYPAETRLQPAYRASVDVQQLDGHPGGEVVLKANWTIDDPASDTTLLVGKYKRRLPVSDQSVDSLVAVYSRAVVELGQELAERIHGLATGKAEAD